MARIILTYCLRAIGSLIIFFSLNAYAFELATEVEIQPARGEISFSTVTLDKWDWVTAPSVEMSGRKELNILNTSSTGNIWLCDVSGNTTITRGTVKRVLYPRQNVTFRISDDIHIYMTADTVINAEIVEIK